jgi:GWxTD domain-containing protein
MRRLIAVLILFYAVSLYADNPVSWKDLQNNMNSWIEGPVSLILASQEKNVWGKLKTPEEKMQFIKIFWARRDPILRTRENEFKEEFLTRVDYANQNFAEKDTAGWKTARGQVYVMFGAPSRVDHQTIAESSRPALLWVYDKTPSKRIPVNEALMFIWRDFKYVLNPPNPDPGDTIGEQQASFDSSFRYVDIPSMVRQAFADVSEQKVIDEKKNYDSLVFSVRSSEKFGIASIDFEIHSLKPNQVEINIPTKSAPVYDSGREIFAEFLFTQELKQGDKVVTRNEHSQSFTWTPTNFDKLDAIPVKLPELQAPAGQYDLYVTVEDRISGVGYTKKISVTL